MPYWERGLYNGLSYRRDCRNGWWEYDDGACECIFFTKHGTMMTTGKRFCAVCSVPVPSITVHECDHPSNAGVRDQQERTIWWGDIFSVKSLRKLCGTFMPRFQARLGEQHQDSIARYLFMRDWNRTRLCNYALSAVSCNADIMFTKFLPARLRRRGGHKVVLQFSREQHRAADPLWVDTVVYLPIGSYVWPANDAAPGGVDACDWLWVKYRLPHWLHEAAGWIHPDSIASTKR